MGFLVMCAFWTLIIIHSIFDGLKLPLVMIGVWFAAGYLCGSLELGGIIFMVAQAVMCLILMVKTGISRIG